MERRLTRLEVLWQRRVPPEGTAPYDLSRLTLAERHELDALLARVARLPPRANGRPDFSPLSDAELERVMALGEKSMEAI